MPTCRRAQEKTHVMQIRKVSRNPPIYEENPTGPPITREDFFKTAAALRGVLAMVRQTFGGASDKDMSAAFKQIGRMMSAEVGRQWSVLTAMQYLTGQRADKASRYWAAAFEEAGMTRARMDALIAVANDFCANGHGRKVSSGLMVEEYRKRPMGPEVLLELLELPEDVIDQVKARVAQP